MWIKLLLAVLIILFCTFLGYFAGSKYRSRKKFFAQMAAFNEKYLSELDYARRPLSEIVASLDEGGEFVHLLKNYLKTRTFEQKISYLTAEEREDCDVYLKMLGTGDALSQRGFFASQKALLDEKRTTTEKELKERGGLYLKLGFLAGLAFVILII